MPFQAGQSGNPKGRPKGVFNRKTRFQEALAQFDGEHVGKLLTTLYEEGVKGDITSAKIFLDYVLSKADKQITFGFDEQDDKDNSLEHLRDIQLKALCDISQGSSIDEVCP